MKHLVDASAFKMPTVRNNSKPCRHEKHFKSLADSTSRESSNPLVGSKSYLHYGCESCSNILRLIIKLNALSNEVSYRTYADTSYLTMRGASAWQKSADLIA